MLNINLPKEPFWLDMVHGIRLHVRPLSSAEYFAALQRSAQQVRTMLEERADIEEMGGKVEGLPDISDEAAQRGLSQASFATALAQGAVFEWEGVGEDAETPAECTKDNIGRLMRISTVADDFLKKYVAHVEALLSEGEGSPAAPRGTIAAGHNTVPSAGNSSSPAPKEASEKTGTAAPTSKTNRKRSRAGKSGGSSKRAATNSEQP